MGFEAKGSENLSDTERIARAQAETGQLRTELEKFDRENDERAVERKRKAVTREREALAREGLSPEALNLPKVMLVFRENDLYSPEFVSNFRDAVRGAGRRVEVMTFPRGTEQEIITNWIIDHRDALNGVDLMADGTFLDARNAISNREQRPQLNTNDSIDRLIDKVTQLAVLGGTDKDKKLTLIEGKAHFDAEPDDAVREKAYTEAAIAILKKMLAGAKEQPKKVYVVEERLTDHEGGKNEKGFVGDLRLALLWQQRLATAGVPEANIMRVSSLSKLPPEALVAGSWVLLDRHLYKPDTQGGRVFQLPIRHFFEDAKDLLEGAVDAKVVNELMKTMLAKRYGKNQEKRKED